MSDPLPIPPELEHLIEKRTTSAGRRKKSRRTGNRREVNLGPLGTLETAESFEDAVLEERRKSEERRTTTRRGKTRRKREPKS
jgi:hypothetical protein